MIGSRVIAPLLSCAALLGLLGAFARGGGVRFSPSVLSPAGPDGLRALLSGDVLDRRGVAGAVRAQGFYAGEPLGSGECASCHAEIAAQWQGSAHRFASFNNPYYAASVEAFRRQRSPAASRFCAGCHDPLLLVDGTIEDPALSRETPASQAGLPCLVCHSITAVHGTTGNGAYVLSALPVPPPRGRDGGSPSEHTRRLRPGLLGKSALCSACHKVGLGPEITHDVWLRGQNDYDAWHASVVAGNGVAALYRPEKVTPRTCQDCHMPLEPTRSGKLVRSHRFLAANSALPALRGDEDMAARTAEFLRGAVSLDLIIPRSGATPALEDRVAVPPGRPVLIDVVLRNRRVGHRFPGGTNDSNEVYLEVEAASPARDRTVRDRTHLVRAQPVDMNGAPLMRRDPQNMAGVVYDTSLSPADPQVVRYLLDPADLGAGPPLGEIEVRAALRYRKFSAAYAAFACAELPAGTDREVRRRCLDPPVMTIASAKRTLLPGAGAKERGAPQDGSLPAWQRYLDHGIGLSDGLVDRAAEALPSLARARELAPLRPEPLLGLARLYLSQGRTHDVLYACERADELRPDHPYGLWLRAQALYRAYRWQEALPYLERALALLPEDRNVLSMLARVRGLNGDARGALALADRLLGIDPESEEGHYQRMLALRDLGRREEAEAAERSYLYHRRPVERDLMLRRLFRERDPDRMEEDTPAHTHKLR